MSDKNNNMIEITDSEFHPEEFVRDPEGYVDINPADPSKEPPNGGLNQGTIYNIAHAARRKTGTSELKIPSEIPALIEDIQVSGTDDHSNLKNRDLPNQHPIEAIDGLSDYLYNEKPISNSKGGFAGGYEAQAENGIALGKNAVSQGKNSVQINQGVNREENSIKFGDTFLFKDGKIPQAILPSSGGGGGGEGSASEADWNANEGEPGFIKNKPFGTIITDETFSMILPEKTTVPPTSMAEALVNKAFNAGHKMNLQPGEIYTLYTGFNIANKDGNKISDDEIRQKIADPSIQKKIYSKCKVQNITPILQNMFEFQGTEPVYGLYEMIIPPPEEGFNPGSSTTEPDYVYFIIDGYVVTIDEYGPVLTEADDCTFLSVVMTPGTECFYNSLVILKDNSVTIQQIDSQYVPMNDIRNNLFEPKNTTQYNATILNNSNQALVVNNLASLNIPAMGIEKYSVFSLSNDALYQNDLSFMVNLLPELFQFVVINNNKPELNFSLLTQQFPEFCINADTDHPQFKIPNEIASQIGLTFYVDQQCHITCSGTTQFDFSEAPAARINIAPMFFSFSKDPERQNILGWESGGPGFSSIYSTFNGNIDLIPYLNAILFLQGAEVTPEQVYPARASYDTIYDRIFNPKFNPDKTLYLQSNQYFKLYRYGETGLSELPYLDESQYTYDLSSALNDEYNMYILCLDIPIGTECGTEQNQLNITAGLHLQTTHEFIEPQYFIYPSKDYIKFQSQFTGFNPTTLNNIYNDDFLDENKRDITYNIPNNELAPYVSLMLCGKKSEIPIKFEEGLRNFVDKTVTGNIDFLNLPLEQGYYSLSIQQCVNGPYLQNISSEYFDHDNENLTIFQFLNPITGQLQYLPPNTTMIISDFPDAKEPFSTDYAENVYSHYQRTVILYLADYIASITYPITRDPSGKLDGPHGGLSDNGPYYGYDWHLTPLNSLCGFSVPSASEDDYIKFIPANEYNYYHTKHNLLTVDNSNLDKTLNALKDNTMINIYDINDKNPGFVFNESDTDENWQSIKIANSEQVIDYQNRSSLAWHGNYSELTKLFYTVTENRITSTTTFRDKNVNYWHAEYNGIYEYNNKTIGQTSAEELNEFLSASEMRLKDCPVPNVKNYAINSNDFPFNNVYFSIVQNNEHQNKVFLRVAGSCDYMFDNNTYYPELYNLLQGCTANQLIAYANDSIKKIFVFKETVSQKEITISEINLNTLTSKVVCVINSSAASLPGTEPKVITDIKISQNSSNELICCCRFCADSHDANIIKDNACLCSLIFNLNCVDTDNIYNLDSIDLNDTSLLTKIVITPLNNYGVILNDIQMERFNPYRNRNLLKILQSRYDTEEPTLSFIDNNILCEIFDTTENLLLIARDVKTHEIIKTIIDPTDSHDGIVVNTQWNIISPNFKLFSSSYQNEKDFQCIYSFDNDQWYMTKIPAKDAVSSYLYHSWLDIDDGLTSLNITCKRLLSNNIQDNMSDYLLNHNIHSYKILNSELRNAEKKTNKNTTTQNITILPKNIAVESYCEYMPYLKDMILYFKDGKYYTAEGLETEKRIGTISEPIFKRNITIPDLEYNLFEFNGPTGETDISTQNNIRLPLDNIKTLSLKTGTYTTELKHAKTFFSCLPFSKSEFKTFVNSLTQCTFDTSSQLIKAEITIPFSSKWENQYHNTRYNFNFASHNLELYIDDYSYYSNKNTISLYRGYWGEQTPVMKFGIVSSEAKISQDDTPEVQLQKLKDVLLKLLTQEPKNFDGSSKELYTSNIGSFILPNINQSYGAFSLDNTNDIDYIEVAQYKGANTMSESIDLNQYWDGANILENSWILLTPEQDSQDIINMGYTHKVQLTSENILPSVHKYVDIKYPTFENQYNNDLAPFARIKNTQYSFTKQSYYNKSFTITSTIELYFRKTTTNQFPNLEVLPSIILTQINEQ